MCADDIVESVCDIKENLESDVTIFFLWNAQGETNAPPAPPPQPTNDPLPVQYNGLLGLSTPYPQQIAYH